MAEVTHIRLDDKKVNNMYKAVNHNEVAKIMRVAFVKHGIVMAPSVIEHEEDRWSGTRTTRGQHGQETTREVMVHKTRVMIEVAFINIENPQDRMVVRYPGIAMDDQDKGVGKAISYAIKYAVLKSFCLESSEDEYNSDVIEYSDITMNPKKNDNSEQNKTKREKIGAAEAKFLEDLVAQEELFSKEVFYNRIKEKYSAKSISDLNHEQYDWIVGYMKEQSQAKKIA